MHQAAWNDAETSGQILMKSDNVESCNICEFYFCVNLTKTADTKHGYSSSTKTIPSWKHIFERQVCLRASLKTKTKLATTQILILPSRPVRFLASYQATKCTLVFRVGSLCLRPHTISKNLTLRTKLLGRPNEQGCRTGGVTLANPEIREWMSKSLGQDQCRSTVEAATAWTGL